MAVVGLDASVLDILAAGREKQEFSAMQLHESSSSCTCSRVN